MVLRWSAMLAHDASALSGAVIADGALEGVFREGTLRHDARSALLVFLPWMLPLVAFAAADWQLFGAGRTFTLLLALRAGALLASLALAVAVLRVRSPRALDALTLVWITVLATTTLVVHATRSRAYHFSLVEGFIVILAAWCLLPTRWRVQAAAAALLSLVYGVVLFRFRDPLQGPARYSVPVYFLVIHVFGAAASRRMHRQQRLAFLAHRAEAAARAAEVEARGALARALRELATLKGIVPICASCKDVRAPDGTWHRLDHMVARDTGTAFSHGLCERCEALLDGQVAS